MPKFKMKESAWNHTQVISFSRQLPPMGRRAVCIQTVVSQKTLYSKAKTKYALLCLSYSVRKWLPTFAASLLRCVVLQIYRKFIKLRFLDSIYSHNYKSAQPSSLSAKKAVLPSSQKQIELHTTTWKLTFCSFSSSCFSFYLHLKKGKCTYYQNRND